MSVRGGRALRNDPRPASRRWRGSRAGQVASLNATADPARTLRPVRALNRGGDVGRRVVRGIAPVADAMSPGPPLAAAVAAVIGQWQAERLISEQTLLRAGETITRY